jgi:glycosyltransferase involved in cell wall biosynthesis
VDRVVAVLPALNEADALPAALAGVPAWLDVIVVDNASTDGTAAVATALGARVVHEPFRGYGAAVQRGLAAAVGADHIAILDADATFDWADLPAMLAPLRDGTADVVFGRRVPHRREPGAMPWHVAFANGALGRVCGWFAGTPLHDIGPFKVVRGDVVARIGAGDRTYGWPLEFALRAARTGLRVAEVDVAYRVRAGVSKVTGRPWATAKTAGKMLVVLARHALTLSPGARDRRTEPIP